ARPGARPAPHQRPPRRQSRAIPVRPRRAKGVRTVMKPAIRNTSPRLLASADGSAAADGIRRGATRWRIPVVAALALALAGCSLLGGSGGRERATIYAPDPRVTLDATTPTVSW